MNIRLPITAICVSIFGGILMSAGHLCADQLNDVTFNRQWAEASFNTVPTAINYENKFAVVHEDSPGDTKIGRASVGGTLRLGNKVYTHGIGTNSHCVLRVTLSKPAARFMADIGMDRNVDNTRASSAFHVSVGGKDLYKSKVFRSNGEMESVDIPLNGAKEFDLTLDVGGDDRSFDQGIWADPRVVMQDGSILWVDEIAGRAQVNTDLPFSFVYGGKMSSDFIRSWKSDVKQVKVGTDKLIRTLTFTDPDTGLEVKAVANIYLDTPGVDWIVYFTNTGLKDTPIIEQVKAVSSSVKPSSSIDPILHRLKGSTSCAAFTMEDYLPYSDSLAKEKKIDFGVGDTHSSFEVFPTFNLQWQNGGVITSVGWTGCWNASVENNADGDLSVNAGMTHMKLKLHPGETIRSPRIMQLYWSGNDEAASYNLFRRTMIAHVTPRIDGKPVTPPIAHTGSGVYETINSTEAIEMSHLNAVKGLGFESYWLDAWWFRPKYPDGIGNWGFPLDRIPDLVRFPHGVKPISDAAHNAGMNFILWMATERVYANTFLAKEHPGWLVPPDGNGGLFNITIPEARKFMTEYINGAIKGFGMDVYRNDSGPGLSEFRSMDERDGPDREGISEIRYFEALYQIWDDIIKTNPHVFIDNCCGGGTRIDLETCSRSIPLWRTDTQVYLCPSRPLENAIDNQKNTAALSRYMPFNTGGTVGTTPYLFRSGVNAGITYCEDVRPANFPREQMKQAIVETKRIRKYFLGDMYPLTKVNVDTEGWHVMQYHRPEYGDGMVMAFRRNESPYASYACELRGIDLNARYEVTKSSSFKQGKPVGMRGSQLQGLVVSIKEMPGSMLIEYRKVK